MKTMDPGMWQGTNRSNNRSHCGDEQRRHGAESAFSCSGTCEADHQSYFAKTLLGITGQYSHVHL